MRLTLFFILLFSFSFLGFSAEKLEPVSVHMEAHKIVLENKIEQRRSAAKTKPSDVIEYSATYQNNTDHSIQHLLATLPIPQGMVYMPNTTTPKQAQASLDGSTYADMPLKRRVQLPSGEWEIQLVPYVEYRFLRWNLQTLQSKKNKIISARMRVAPLTAKESL